jgi:hypothetical protein
MAVAALLLSPTLTYRLGVDQGSFAYIGDQLLAGRWPYLGTWESDFPGMMFLQAAEIFVFGKSIVTFRLFDLLFQLANVYLIYRIASKLGGRVGALLAVAVFCLIYQGYGPWNTAQREGFGMLFVLIGYWWYLTRERRSAVRTALGIGVGLGIAAMFKPTFLVLAAFYVPLGLRWSRGHLRYVFLAAAGVAAPALATIALYAALGGLRELYEATVAYQSIYTARLRGDSPWWAFWWSKLHQVGATSWLIGLAYLPYLFFGRALPERRMVYLGYLGALLGVWVQGTFAGYHYLPGLALGAILIGTAFSLTVLALRARFPSFLRWRGTETAAVALMIIAALPFYLRADTLRRLVGLSFLEPPVPGEFRNGTVFDFTEDTELAAFLRARTGPGDRIQVWAYDPVVYYLADRRAASRFYMTHPLVMRPPGGELSNMQHEWRREFLQDMHDNHPVFVAVARHDDWWWAPMRLTSEQLLGDFPEWKSFIEENYELERAVGRFLVYGRTDSARIGDRAGDPTAQESQ